MAATAATEAAIAADSAVRIAGELIPKLHHMRLFKEVPGAGERLTQDLDAAGFPKEIIPIIEDAGPLEMVLGGSAVLRAVEGVITGKEPNWKSGDFDLFVSGVYDGHLEHITELHRALDAAGLVANDIPESAYTRVSLWRIEKVTEYCSKSGSVLQVIERYVHDVPTEEDWQETQPERYSARAVVFSTDFDVLRNYFDGARVWSARVASEAIKAGAVGIPSSICCKSDEAVHLGYRAAKYTERGFSGLPREVHVRFDDLEKLPDGSKSEELTDFYALYDCDHTRRSITTTSPGTWISQEVFTLRSRTKSAAK